jgi:hypothetical protein
MYVLTQTLTFNTNGPESIARGKDMTRGISFQGEGEESPQVRIVMESVEKWREWSSSREGGDENGEGREERSGVG